MKTIKFPGCLELINPNLKTKEVKRIMKDNFDFYAWSDINEQSLWNFFKMNIYYKTIYFAKKRQNFYETDIILDLNRKVEELKQLIFQQKKSNNDNLIFSFGNYTSSEDSTLNNENLFEKELTYMRKFSENKLEYETPY